MNLHQDMEREQMRMAILKQEQIFRQQVHELHRLYHVQMQQMPTTALPNRAPVIADVKPKPQLDIWHGEKATNPQQFISFSSYKAHAPSPAPAPAPSDECNLDLTLATSPSSSNSCNTERQHGKRLKSASNSEGGCKEQHGNRLLIFIVLFVDYVFVFRFFLPFFSL